MIDLERLRRFVAVIDTRSFTVAAAALRMSQPALSQSIARLERELGCVLVHRNKQNPAVGVVPTLAGAALYPDAVDVLAAAERWETRARRLGAERDRVSVVVGFSPGTPRRLVSAALAQADAGADGAEVAAIQLVWGHEHEALAQGSADVLIHQYPRGSALPGCVSFGLMHVARVAMLPADHRLAAHTSVTVADLAGEPILDPGLRDAPAGYRELWLGLPRPESAPLGEIVGPVNRTVDEMCAFVAAHRGMAITSRSVAEENVRADVVARVITDLDPLEIGAVVRADDTRPAVRAVVSRLVAAAAAE